MLLLLGELLLEGWSWLGEGASSDVHGSSPSVSLDSQLCGVSNVSIHSSLTSNTHDSSVDSAGNTVMHLHVNFWEVELLLRICGGLLNILLGRSVDDSLHLEPLDALILSDGPSAVAAHA